MTKTHDRQTLWFAGVLMGMIGTFLMAYSFSRVLLRLIDQVSSREESLIEMMMKVSGMTPEPTTEQPNLYLSEPLPNQEPLPWATGLTEEDLRSRYDPMTERPLEF